MVNCALSCCPDSPDQVKVAALRVGFGFQSLPRLVSLEVTVQRLTYGGGRNQRQTQKQSTNLHPIPPCHLILFPATFEDIATHFVLWNQGLVQVLLACGFA